MSIGNKLDKDEMIAIPEIDQGKSKREKSKLI